MKFYNPIKISKAKRIRPGQIRIISYGNLPENGGDTNIGYFHGPVKILESSGRRCWIVKTTRKTKHNFGLRESYLFNKCYILRG